jgi:hypothetical protein
MLSRHAWWLIRRPFLIEALSSSVQDWLSIHCCRDIDMKFIELHVIESVATAARFPKLPIIGYWNMILVVTEGEDPLTLELSSNVCWIQSVTFLANINGNALLGWYLKSWRHDSYTRCACRRGSVSVVHMEWKHTCAEWVRIDRQARSRAPLWRVGQPVTPAHTPGGGLRLKCDGTRAETRFRLSVERTSPFKSAGASVQSTTGSWGVRISGSNAGYTMLWGSVKGTGYPLHLPVSPSLPSQVRHRVPSRFNWTLSPTRTETDVQM